MKRIYIFFSLMVLVMGMISCNDNKEIITVNGFQNGEPGQLIASNNEIVLNSETQAVTALTLSWGDFYLSISDDNYNLPNDMVAKYLELADNESFNGAEATLMQSNNKSFTHVELNNLTKKMGYEPWQATPLYVRIRYVLGNNLAPHYSNSLAVSITPYGIRMNTMEMLAKDQETVIGYLYSPTENGIYQGYVGASGWMNAFFKENDGTLWGNDGIIGTPFKLSNDVATLWNVWYPGAAGSYLTTINTVSGVWSAELLTNLAVMIDGEPVDMKFSVPQNTWTGSFKASKALTVSSAIATTKIYNIDTDTNDDAAIDGSLEFTLNASVPKAGNYIIKLPMGTELIEAIIEEGEIEESTYFNYLDMVNPDNWDDVKCRLYSPEENYIYQGFCYAASYENFKFATEDRETVYGSVPESLYELDATGAAWNIWMDTENNGFYMYTANLANHTWSAEEITAVAVSGDFNGWSIETDLMQYDVENKIWTAVLNIDFIEWGMNIILNNNWDMKMTLKSNGVLQYGAGNNIVPAETGTYLFTINMWDMGNITYTLEKQ